MNGLEWLMDIFHVNLLNYLAIKLDFSFLHLSFSCLNKAISRFRSLLSNLSLTNSLRVLVLLSSFATPSCLKSRLTGT